MEFTKSLIKGKLIKRYKRFFVDVKLDKKTVTAHCPNTGSMKGLLDQNNVVYLLKNDDPKRKLKYTLEIIKAKKNLVGVNTHFANKIVKNGLSNNPIIEPVLGQCAVIISLFAFISAKNLLYLFTSLPLIKDLVNSIFKIYIRNV